MSGHRPFATSAATALILFYFLVCGGMTALWISE